MTATANVTRPALEQTHCTKCGSLLYEGVDGICCGGECGDQPMYGGLVQLRPNGLAGCDGCGWTGIPTFVDGAWSTHCPSCEGFGNEPDLRERTLLRRHSGPLKQDVWIMRDGVYIGARPKPQASSRNAPCPCGSGKKWKRCHGR